MSKIPAQKRRNTETQEHRNAGFCFGEHVHSHLCKQAYPFMFILKRGVPPCKGPHLGLQVQRCLKNGQERVEVLDIAREGLVHHRNYALEQTVGLVERPLRMLDLIVDVNGEQTIDGILAQLRDLDSLQLCMRIERPRKNRGLSVLEVQEHVAADSTYWMQQCQCRFITLAWERLITSDWDDITWRVAGRDAFHEVLEFLHVAFTMSVFDQRFEPIADMPDFVQQVFNSDLNRRRFDNDAHPNQRNLAQLGDAILLMNLIHATNECRKGWWPQVQQWRSFCQGSLPHRAAARGAQADLFTDWEFDEVIEIRGHGREAQHDRSTVVETVIAELWLHVQDEAAPDQERTRCGAMLTFMTYHILWRRLEIEIHHPDDLEYGLAQSFPLWC